MAGTVIGAGLNIEGEITSQEEVVMDGSLRGKLTSSEGVSIGPSSVVQADVAGQRVSIAGQVTGDVTAPERVDIQAGGRLVGDVKAARFTIADGASFKGAVDMEI
jgi:cytoskeletal protein CcmA (bactofilin family)